MQAKTLDVQTIEDGLIALTPDIEPRGVAGVPPLSTFEIKKNALPPEVFSKGGN